MNVENSLAQAAAAESLYDNPDVKRRLDGVAERLRTTGIPEQLSRAESIALMSEDERADALVGVTKSDYEGWEFWARPKQLPPEGDWAVWIVRAGRGFGKTRAAGGWIHRRAMEFPGRWIALVAKTPADARDYNIEGPGGILKNTPQDERPLYEPSKRRLTWPNGSWATIYSDEEPDQLRGFSGDTACLDEFGKYKHPREVWDNLQFGMREPSGDRPRIIIPTTPRPLKVLQEIEQMSDTVTTRGSSYDNRANLSPKFIQDTLAKYEGTRLGRQEIHAEYLDDTPGALWVRDLIEALRVKLEAVPELKRIVVAIDPNASSKEGANAAGIMVGGRGMDDHAYILEDCTVEQATPAGWGGTAVDAYHRHIADRIVAEVNNGGEMVEFVIRTIDENVSYNDVWASRGKQTRAEPVSALYEQGRVHHVGGLPELEDEMCTWVPGQPSPNRMDALVWLVTDLMPDLMQRERGKKKAKPRVFFPGMKENGAANG